MAACVCVGVLDTYPIVRVAAAGRTWGGRVGFLPGAHGIGRVLGDVSVSQHEGRALGPALLSSVQLDTLDRPPRREDLPEAGDKNPGETKWGISGSFLYGRKEQRKKEKRTLIYVNLWFCSFSSSMLNIA